MLTGLLGRDLSGSLSPALHNHAFQLAGVSGLYQPVDFSAQNLADESLPDILKSVINLGFLGVNVTHPFKTAVLPLLDELSDDAAGLGAVNTVVIREGKTVGHNTDWQGFSAQLKMPEALSGPALVLGAGGAGRAVVHALLQLNTGPVFLSDPSADQASALIRDFGNPAVQLCENIETSAGDARILVNASTVGMHGLGGLPLPEHLIKPDHLVAEVVYFPVDTLFVRTARNKGCRVVTGDIMCFNQARIAFELMTGLTANTSILRRYFDELLNRTT
jgi:shikimate dehydrogenase